MCSTQTYYQHRQAVQDAGNYYKCQATLISVTSSETKAIRNLPDKMSTTILTTTIIKHKTFTLTSLFMSVASEKEKAVWTIRHIVLVT